MKWISGKSPTYSVTSFGEISPLWQHFKSLGQNSESLFRIWQSFEPTLSKMLNYWANFLDARLNTFHLLFWFWGRWSSEIVNKVSLHCTFIPAALTKDLIKRNRNRVAFIAPWFRLHLPTCGRWFESQAYHLSFFNLYYWNGNEKRTKINKKRPRLGHFLKKDKEIQCLVKAYLSTTDSHMYLSGKERYLKGKASERLWCN